MGDKSVISVVRKEVTLKAPRKDWGGLLVKSALDEAVIGMPREGTDLSIVKCEVDPADSDYALVTVVSETSQREF
ncbi:MAG: hypothetical protein MJA83_16640 [Gammaproteobacteria bacterium]|nr:hypothetical protein [Gammaproteobacteria bacterium]